ncbi:hypothetical protein JCM11491_006355 [Sporobolomyces phaffii]
MSIHSLPPEVLLLVFALVRTEAWGDIARDDHFCFLEDLDSLSRVHPSWTRLAQSLMLEQVFLDIATVETLERAAWLPFASTQVKAIVTDGCPMFSRIIRPPASQTWPSVVYVRLVDNLELDLGLLAYFPNLATLECWRMEFHLVRPDYTFPALQRLVFRQSTVSGSLGDVQALFSAKTMPKVRHLALDVTSHAWRSHDHDHDQTFRHLLPQITTLALTGSGMSVPDYSQLTPCMPHMVELAHLLHDLALHNLPEFLGAIRTPIKLDSLHLRNGREVDGERYNRAVDEIIAISRQDEGAKIRTGKVYLYLCRYSSAEAFANLAPYVHFVRGYPACDVFDGSPRFDPRLVY